MIAAGAAAVAALFAFAALGGVGVGQSAIGAAQYKADKVKICHKAGPNGKRVTITVSANAWPAHQRHGDTLGACTQTATQSSKGKGNGKGKGKQNGNKQSGSKQKDNKNDDSEQSSGAATGKGKGKGNGQK
jgi:hypothetical protein